MMDNKELLKRVQDENKALREQIKSNLTYMEHLRDLIRAEKEAKAKRKAEEALVRANKAKVRAARRASPPVVRTDLVDEVS